LDHFCGFEGWLINRFLGRTSSDINKIKVLTPTNVRFYKITSLQKG
jgi:hypothetical protein